ncbi:hypothetical protein AArcMg_1791 [Natrarchaeobaculum sulfurireducens]|uniref:DUF8216 domain-containing protein n=1 Tax=Natrarchaeobaculum sulfurireducens TaxID=2044521 RepID=A0A346PQK4_9EURY|nr:hypothetical protein AArcMg_1791 [Natrarchaeobaculum sulfurireducens]
MLFAITVFGLLALAAVAKFWNIAYTAGFVAFAVLALIMIPGVLGEFVHPAFAALTNLALLLGVLFIGWLFVGKVTTSSYRR